MTTDQTPTPAQGLLCGCCGAHKDLTQLGVLRMYKRRPFNICDECVQFLWKERHWANEEGDDNEIHSTS